MPSLDRQPIRAAEIARTGAYECLPSFLQISIGAASSNDFNALIADSLLSFAGPKSLSKPIRALAPELSSKEAVQVAVFCFAWAMEEATIEHMISIGLNSKKTIASADCCSVCQANKDQGSIPVSEPFQSGHMHAPFCFTCRCATAAAR